MTFEDEIRPVHWEDMLARMRERKLLFAVRGGIVLTAVVALLVASAMGTFVYAAVKAIASKGIDGMAAAPLIPALIALGLLYGLAGRRPDVMTLILAGVAINAFAGALTSLALNLAPSPFAALEIVFWVRDRIRIAALLHPVVAGRPCRVTAPAAGRSPKLLNR